MDLGCEMYYRINIDHHGHHSFPVSYVVIDEFEITVRKKMSYVRHIAIHEIIQADHFVTFLYESLGQMRTNESRSTSYQNLHKLTMDCDFTSAIVI